MADTSQTVPARTPLKVALRRWANGFRARCGRGLQYLWGQLQYLGGQLVLGLAKAFAFDLDGMPFNTKDGYAPFSALATFAIGQAAAVTAFAKGHDRVVVAVYAITVTVTLAWLIAMLRATRDEPVGTPPVMVPHRAYDRPTITYGRYALGWTVILSGIITFMGFNLLLPNQTKRLDYLEPDVKVNVASLSNRNNGALPAMPGEEGDRPRLDVWVRWLAIGEDLRNERQRLPRVLGSARVAAGLLGAPPAPVALVASVEAALQSATEAPAAPFEEHLVWIEQRTPFPDYYKSFPALLKCASTHTLGQKVAFLVRRDGSSPRPIYRQLSFQPNEQGGTSNKFEVLEPDPGEFLVVLAVVSTKAGEAPQLPTGYDLKIERDQ